MKNGVRFESALSMLVLIVHWSDFWQCAAAFLPWLPITKNQNHVWSFFSSADAIFVLPWCAALNFHRVLTISFSDWLLYVIMASCTLLARCCWHLVWYSVQVRESISKDLTSHPIQSGAVAAHGTVSQSLNTAPSNSSTQASFGFDNQTCWAEYDPVRGKLLESNVSFGCWLYF